MDEYEEGTDVHILDDGFLVLGIGLRDGQVCTYILKTDREGEQEWLREYTDFYGLARETVLRDSILYMPGEVIHADGSYERDGYRLYRFDLKGNRIDSKKYDLSLLENAPVDSIRRYAPHGNLIYEDKIVMYGEVYEFDPDVSDVFSRGLMMWFNMDLSLDTMIFIQPRYREVDIWDAKIGPDGLITLLVDDATLDNGVRSWYRTFIKYDAEGNRVWSSTPYQLIHPYSIFLSEAVLDNGDMIMYYDNDEPLVRSKELLSVSKDDVINWLVRLDPNYDIDYRNILDVSAAKDGNILIAGTYDDLPFLRQGAYLAKYERNTGELLWERVFQDWTELWQSGSPANDLIWQIKIAEDGSIILVGQRSKKLDGGGSDRDLLLISLDDDGCLQPDCGGFEQHVAGTPKYYSVVYEGDYWYHQDPEARDGIYKGAIRDVRIDGEDVHSMRRGEIILEVDEVGGFLPTGDILTLENEGRQVYWREDGTQNILLYDFTLDVGDIFSSDYVAQDLEVIESDTILLLNGAKRRTWTLACMENPENTITWIEQIGTDYGVLWPRDFCSGDYGDVRLTCYYRFEQLHYINEDIGGCFLSSTFDPESTLVADISVHPIPTQDHLTISAPDDLHITRTELLNLHGRTNTRFHEHTSEVQLDLSSYPSGLYFVSIHTDKGAVVKKVVVE